MMIIVELNKIFVIFGLACTALGALISVLNIAGIKDKNLAENAISRWGYSESIYYSLLLQKGYSIFGFSLILIGTILQIIPNMCSIYNQLIVSMCTILTVMMFVLFLLYIYLFKFMPKRCKMKSKKYC